MPAFRFEAVDATDPAAAKSFLDLASSLREVEGWKRYSHELLKPNPGDHVLDIGSGTGVDAIALAQMVGPNGYVVGVDLSHSLVASALASVKPLGLPVTFRQADIYDLPFPDDSFDRTRIDRVLHFLASPDAALREAVRVTKPGGRMLATEPDWSSLKIKGGDEYLTALILGAAVGKSSSSRIGSELSDYFMAAGLQSVECQVSALELTDYATAAKLFGLESIAAQAVAAGALNAKDACIWLRTLQNSSAHGGLICTLSGMIAVGTRAAGVALMH